MTPDPSSTGSHADARHDTAPDIKAAFFDIDGTLTSFATHEIPASTVQALHALQDRGIRIYICSGRAPSHMSVVLDTMPVSFDGIVAMNGQYCFDDSGFLETESLDPHDVDVINRWLDDHPDVVANFCESDYVYFNQVTDTMRATWRQLGKTAPAVHIDDPHVRTPTHRTYQISPYIPPSAEKELTSLCAHTTGVRWHPSFTDLIPSDGGKPRGIKRFGDRYGFSHTQTIAFGDGGNDATMLRYAGIGVAMGNATAEAKAAADYITDDVDHDGIMNALRHFAIL